MSTKDSAVLEMAPPAAAGWLTRPALDPFRGALAALALVGIAAALTAATHAWTGDNVSLFYLSAAVVSTWLGGLGSGAIVVVAGSILTMNEPMAPPTTWRFTEPHALERLAIFASVALALTFMTARLKRYNQALVRSNEKLRTVLELVPVGVAIVDTNDPEAPAARVNAALAAMIGTDERSYALESPDGAPAILRRDGKPAPVDELPMHRAMSTGHVTPRQFIDISPSGGPVVHAIAQAAPLRDDGAVRGAVASFVDVTEAREREEQLVRANQAKDEFLGMISHELKTPMTIIAGNSEILARRWGDQSEPIQAALQDVRSASHRLLGNIENLLAMSRLDDNALDVEPLDICRILREVARAHAGGDHAIEVRCENMIALGAAGLVSQVLENLIINAEKFSPTGSTIELVAERCGAEVRIAVLDRGTGLTPDEIEDVFRPFYRSLRVSNTTSGIGLGLAVCTRMVTAMGGRIWAAQRDGGGAEFVFSLPRLDGDEPA